MNTNKSKLSFQPTGRGVHLIPHQWCLPSHLLETRKPTAIEVTKFTEELKDTAKENTKTAPAPLNWLLVTTRQQSLEFLI